MAWVGVGWQQHCKTCHSLHELDHQGTVFFFFGGQLQLAVELDSLCEVENFYSARREWSYHAVFMVRHPRGSYVILSLLSMEMAIPEIKLSH